MGKTDESIGGGTEQRQRACGDGGIHLYDEEEEVD